MLTQVSLLVAWTLSNSRFTDCVVLRVERQVNAANCTYPCWTNDARNQQMVSYMLNLEYLLAESYSCWSTGSGIPDSLRGGGPPSVGCQQMAFQDPLIAVRFTLERRPETALVLTPCCCAPVCSLTAWYSPCLRAQQFYGPFCAGAGGVVCPRQHQPRGLLAQSAGRCREPHPAGALHTPVIFQATAPNIVLRVRLLSNISSRDVRTVTSGCSCLGDTAGLTIAPALRS